MEPPFPRLIMMFINDAYAVGFDLPSAEDALLLPAERSPLDDASGTAVRARPCSANLRHSPACLRTAGSASISPCGGRWAEYSSARLSLLRAQISAIASRAPWISGSTARRIPSKQKASTGGRVAALFMFSARLRTNGSDVWTWMAELVWRDCEPEYVLTRTGFDDADVWLDGGFARRRRRLERRKDVG